MPTPFIVVTRIRRTPREIVDRDVQMPDTWRYVDSAQSERLVACASSPLWASIYRAVARGDLKPLDWDPRDLTRAASAHVDRRLGGPLVRMRFSHP